MCLEEVAWHGMCSPIYEKGEVGAQPQQAERSYNGRRVLMLSHPSRGGRVEHVGNATDYSLLEAS